MKSALLLFIACYFLSCSGKKKVTGKELMPDMALTDSMELIFFKSPDDVRNFTYLPVNEKDFIKAIVHDVSGAIREEATCLKEGKIYCYKKGEIFNTIFFAYLDEDCKVLRYIKNGNLYYFPLSEKVKISLERYKKEAIVPR